ncbi:hypothetical protein E6Q11_02395 [Candidatus Dojkabacteria bacterium]|uniref:Helix-turn-helix domain-containing protein n=1 Tax=Candidatus Dojkabacteria bacterium TaxID=2099670 RepID=A0A5C7J8L3_9BACT|nr:MAG: hypothetical protein E6Q11_02395 [Candidatus Dojkabacteria bacterium]
MRKRTKTKLDAYEREQRKQRVIALLKEGMSVPKINKLTGMSIPSIYLYKKKLKVKRRNLQTPVLTNNGVSTMEKVISGEELRDYITNSFKESSAKRVGISLEPELELTQLKSENKKLRVLIKTMIPVYNMGLESVKGFQTELTEISNEGH